MRKPSVATLPAGAILQGKFSRPANIVHYEQNVPNSKVSKGNRQQRETSRFYASTTSRPSAPRYKISIEPKGNMGGKIIEYNVYVAESTQISLMVERLPDATMSDVELKWSLKEKAPIDIRCLRETTQLSRDDNSQKCPIQLKYN